MAIGINVSAENHQDQYGSSAIGFS